jgi:hypothetical protein
VGKFTATMLVNSDARSDEGLSTGADVADDLGVDARSLLAAARILCYRSAGMVLEPRERSSNACRKVLLRSGSLLEAAVCENAAKLPSFIVRILFSKVVCG